MTIIFYTNVRERRPVKPPETAISSQALDSAAERDSLTGEGWVPVSGYAGSRGFGAGSGVSGEAFVFVAERTGWCGSWRRAQGPSTANPSVSLTDSQSADQTRASSNLRNVMVSAAPAVWVRSRTTLCFFVRANKGEDQNKRLLHYAPAALRSQ
jgi:hypothetical protein